MHKNNKYFINYPTKIPAKRHYGIATFNANSSCNAALMNTINEHLPILCVNSEDHQDVQKGCHAHVLQVLTIMNDLIFYT